MRLALPPRRLRPQLVQKAIVRQINASSCLELLGHLRQLDLQRTGTGIRLEDRCFYHDVVSLASPPPHQCETDTGFIFTRYTIR